jgi:transposase
MTRPYSCDLREAVAATVLVDGMSCRAAAKVFRVSVSSVVRWTQLKRQNGSCEPKPMGGRRRVILLSERAWVRARLAADPDLTWRALRAELLARGVRVSYGAVWAFLKLERLSFKKPCARPSGDARTWRAGAPVGCAISAALTANASYSSTRLGPRPT